jgi:hypothetical protein
MRWAARNAASRQGKAANRHDNAQLMDGFHYAKPISVYASITLLQAKQTVVKLLIPGDFGQIPVTPFVKHLVKPGQPYGQPISPLAQPQALQVDHAVTFSYCINARHVIRLTR